MHDRLARGEVGHAHVLPADAHAKTGAEGLRAGLLRRPAFRVGARRWSARRSAFRALDVGEDALARKPVAEALEGLLDVARCCRDRVPMPRSHGRRVCRGARGLASGGKALVTPAPLGPGAMRCAALPLAAWLLAGCEVTAWNTTIADSADRRLAMGRVGHTGRHDRNRLHHALGGADPNGCARADKPSSSIATWPTPRAITPPGSATAPAT